MTQPALRIIDANLNRAAEGLRVLEEFARLVLNDTALTQQLKTMRHQIVRSDAAFQRQLLQARDSAGDVGTNLEATGDKKERELSLVVIANSRRVQESLRVLEELAKLPDISPSLDSDLFKQARFSLYTIERALLSRLLRRDKIQQISGLYTIIDTQALVDRHPVEAARQVIRGGAKLVQLRDKRLSKRELLETARAIKILCAQNGALFIVNDFLDIALAAGADGLHVGQDDLPVPVARRALPIDKIVGCSVLTVAQAVTAQADGADYIAAGAVFPTRSKDIPVIGLEGLRRIREAVTLPVVAIGGITPQNAAEVVAAGAQSVAVISAVLQTDNIELATQNMVVSLR